MSRSGYTDNCDDPLIYGRWTAQVKSAIRGKRGQAFLQELLVAMDAMPVKELIEEELVTSEGDCCTMGVICKSRNIDVTNIDPTEAEEVGDTLGIAYQMAAEIAYQNDEAGSSVETPEQRWVRMRKWVAYRIASEK